MVSMKVGWSASSSSGAEAFDRGVNAVLELDDSAIGPEVLADVFAGDDRHRAGAAGVRGVAGVGPGDESLTRCGR